MRRLVCKDTYTRTKEKFQDFTFFFNMHNMEYHIMTTIRDFFKTFIFPGSYYLYFIGLSRHICRMFTFLSTLRPTTRDFGKTFTFPGFFFSFLHTIRDPQAILFFPRFLFLNCITRRQNGEVFVSDFLRHQMTSITSSGKFAQFIFFLENI